MTWFKIDAACRYAGGLDRKTLYAAVGAKQLRVSKVGAGRNMLFADLWIDDWLTGRSSRAEEQQPRRAVLELVS